MQTNPDESSHKATAHGRNLLLDGLADFLVYLYGLNRRTLKVRGLYRGLCVASKFLPKLCDYPIRFPGTDEVKVDVNEPEIYWLLNAFVGDHHASMLHLFDIVEAVIKPDDVVWDVGASMGLFSTYFAQPKFQVRSLHLFEPHPLPFRIARALLRNSPIAHFHPIGLGSSKGKAILRFGSGTGGASIKNSGANFDKEIECDIARGDELIERQEADTPNFIKIDVEGFESEVIMGLQQAIQTAEPVICFEILFLSDAEIVKLVPENYRIAYIRDTDGGFLADLSHARQQPVMDAVMAPVDSPLWLKLQSRFVRN